MNGKLLPSTSNLNQSKGSYTTATVECRQSLRSIQSDYARFKQKTPVKRVFDPISELYWTYYECAKTRKTRDSDRGTAELPTVVLLHGICGTAGCYFYVMNKLSEAGVRCISAQYPEYYSVEEWISGLLHFLEYLKLSKPTVFGSDLGGYLLQLFVEKYPESVYSMILCNSYRRTDCFSSSPDLRGLYGRWYSVLPHMILRNIFVESYICPKNYHGIPRVSVMEQLAREFMASELDQLTASDLGSRISLQMSTEYVGDFGLQRMPHSKILIIETNNNNTPEELNEEMRTAYADAKIATMKNGGDFPYLTKPEEIVTFVMVHLTNVRIVKVTDGESESVERTVSCKESQNSHECRVSRMASDSSYSSVIPAQYSWDMNEPLSPTLSDG
ncbi:Maspardin [Babesia sp. Xinjiang]|uniref:Maspardin n=1 Tax=Babesia sp. Xinjiang TaxID=462227 RepID=UPI000A241B51|nr:Maspardin [Babesia sp. Xinjiang]ORM41062.1 Maspardin [Babesia sp. Xinjiang]